MVWISESKRRSIAATQRREMERVLPCAKRIVSMLESFGKFVTPYLNKTIWKDDVIF